MANVHYLHRMFVCLPAYNGRFVTRITSTRDSVGFSRVLEWSVIVTTCKMGGIVKMVQSTSRYKKQLQNEPSTFKNG